MQLNPKHFIRAIKSKNVKAAQICVASRMYSDYDLRQALAFSSFSGFDEGVTLLLSHGQKDGNDYLTDDLERCVDLSASRGHASTMRILESAGANPCHEDDFPFYLSAGRGHKCSTLYLLLRGAKDDNVEYALKTAFKRGHVDLAKECVKLKRTTTAPEMALFEAIRADNIDLARAALLAGADPNQNDAELLYMACRDKRTSIMLLMAAAGGNPLLRGSKEWLAAAKAGGDLRNMEAAKTIYQRAILGGRVLSQLPKKPLEVWKNEPQNLAAPEGRMPEGFKVGTKKLGEAVGSMSKLAIERAPIKKAQAKQALTRVMPRRGDELPQATQLEAASPSVDIKEPKPSLIQPQIGVPTRKNVVMRRPINLPPSEISETATSVESIPENFSTPSPSELKTEEGASWTEGLNDLPSTDGAIPTPTARAHGVRTLRPVSMLTRQAIVSAELEAANNEEKANEVHKDVEVNMGAVISRQGGVFKSSIQETKSEDIPVLTEVVEDWKAKTGPTARGIRKNNVSRVPLNAS